MAVSFFVLLVLGLSGGLLFAIARMILHFLKDRQASTGASLGMSELEAIIQRAVEAGMAPLHDRLDDLEQRLSKAEDRGLLQSSTVPEANPSMEFDELIQSDSPADVPQRRDPVH